MGGLPDGELVERRDLVRLAPARHPRQAFFDRITADTGTTRYFTGEFGIAMLPFTVALAVWCWRRSRELA